MVVKKEEEKEEAKVDLSGREERALGDGQKQLIGGRTETMGGGRTAVKKKINSQTLQAYFFFFFPFFVFFSLWETLGAVISNNREQSRIE